MPEISAQTQKLIQRYQYWNQSLQPKEGVSTIHVDEIASRVASFYEKIRGIVDWKEEHLLKKTAIERILKRRLLLKRNSEESIAEPLALELIRGGHFPNDSIEESKIEEIRKVIEKYLYILENSSPPGKKEKTKEKIKGLCYGWLLGIAACEVEETLAPPIKERSLMDYMEKMLKERVKVKNEMTENEIETQLSIAIQRAVFRLDPTIIGYHLLLKIFPDWRNPSAPRMEGIAKNIYSIWNNIEKKLAHPFAGKFYELCEKYDTPYLILSDVIAKDPQNALQFMESPETLENKIKTAYQERLKRLKSRMKRAAVFSMISVFLTKVLLAIVIEVPFDKYVTDNFSYFVLGLNIIIPSLLMFFLILSIHPPQKSNLQKVIIEVMKISYKKERADIYNIKFSRKRGAILNSFIAFLYFLTFIATFGIISWGLTKLEFSVLSQIIFIIFISVIAFAGTKIRETAKELVVEEKKEGILQGFVEIFATPILQLGRWLSGQWAKYNALIVLFNSLIDMPIQIFVEFLEHWRGFLKEKKEKLR